MKAVVLLLLPFLACFDARSQMADTVQWNFNSDRAKDAKYLSPLEREVVREINKARTDPERYARLYLEPMLNDFKGNLNKKTNVETQEGVSAIKECIHALSKTKPLALMDPNRELEETASYLTTRQSKTKQVGHTAPDGKTFADRLRKLKFPASSECISYGETTARGIVTQLLIDDGVSDRGHRKNLLDPRFSVAGVATGSHLVYRVMCTIDLAMAAVK